MSYLQEHLCDLLKTNECVVVPELGGFVTNERPAQLNRATHRIQPPMREVSFNARLFRNDGLMAQYIRANKGISYEDAMTLIRSEVAWIQRQLDAGHKVAFKQVGALHKDRDNNLAFVPSFEENYLPASFGLEPFFLIPAAAGENEEPTEVVAIRERVASKRLWRNLVGAAIVPVLVAASWFVQQGLSGNTQLSLLPTVERSTDFAPRYEEEGLRFDQPDNTNFVDHHINHHPETDVLRYSLVEDMVSPDGVRIRLKADAPEAMAAEELNVETEVISAPVAPVATTEASSKLKLWFVVGGAFKEPGNAEAFVAKLRGQGYDASIFEQKGDLHLVAFGSYATRQAATEDLERIRANDNPGAWLKRR